MTVTCEEEWLQVSKVEKEMRRIFFQYRVMWDEECPPETEFHLPNLPVFSAPSAQLEVTNPPWGIAAEDAIALPVLVIFADVNVFAFVSREDAEAETEVLLMGESASGGVYHLEVSIPPPLGRVRGVNNNAFASSGRSVRSDL